MAPTIPEHLTGPNGYPRLRPGQMSYLSVPGKEPLLGLTIGQLLDSAAAKFPENDGLIVSDIDSRHSFRELHHEISNLAAGLLNLGLGQGSRVGIWGPNSHLYYVTQLAIWKAGLIAVNINSAFQPRELLACLTSVGIECLVIADKFGTQNYYEMVCEVVPELRGSNARRIESPKTPKLKIVLTMEGKPLPGTLSVHEIMDRGSTSSARAHLAEVEPRIQFDDVCNIQFTSGTTSGYPKGAMLTHHSMINNSFLYGSRHDFSDRDRICLTVPLFHSFGCVTGTILALHFGCTLVMPAKAFSGEASVKAIDKERCTVVYGTPTMHIAMLNAARFDAYDMSSLRLACTGAAPCPMDLVKEMKLKYTVETVGVSYGMTETGPIVFQSLPDDSDATRATTVGYPVEHSEVKVVDTSTGRIVPLGTPGELCVRGYLTTTGYWEEPDKTRELLDSSGWLHTGDLFVMHETGHGSIIGRLKDIIIRGGENIYPKEIEDFLYTHPSILEVQVFGVPDPRFGEEVAAAVILRSGHGHALTEQQVKDYCKGNIAHYKIPRFLRFVREFPKTGSGKIQKFRLRENFAVDQS